MKELELSEKELDMTLYLCRLAANRMENAYFLVRPLDKNSDQAICFMEVVWVEADGNYSHIHLMGKRYVSVSMNIGQVEAILNTSPDGSFIRINRSTIISLRWLDRLDVNLLYLISCSVPFTVGAVYRAKFNKRMSLFCSLKKGNR